jgi:hypothetical protein
MRYGEQERSLAVATAKRDIAVRIRRVCEHLCDAEFDMLVQRMAEIDVHYRLLSDWTLAGVEDEGVTSSSAP